MKHTNTHTHNRNQHFIQEKNDRLCLVPTDGDMEFSNLCILSFSSPLLDLTFFLFFEAGRGVCMLSLSELFDVFPIFLTQTGSFFTTCICLPNKRSCASTGSKNHLKRLIFLSLYDVLSSFIFLSDTWNYIWILLDYIDVRSCMNPLPFYPLSKYSNQRVNPISSSW